jgi:hypothetical protein
LHPAELAPPHPLRLLYSPTRRMRGRCNCRKPRGVGRSAEEPQVVRREASEVDSTEARSPGATPNHRASVAPYWSVEVVSTGQHSPRRRGVPAARWRDAAAARYTPGSSDACRRRSSHCSVS